MTHDNSTGIYRTDSDRNGTHGWIVFAQRRKQIFTKHFSLIASMEARAELTGLPGSTGALDQGARWAHARRVLSVIQTVCTNTLRHPMDLPKVASAIYYRLPLILSSFGAGLVGQRPWSHRSSSCQRGDAQIYGAKINVWRPKGLGYWASLTRKPYGGECSLDGLIWVGMVGIANPLRPRMNEIIDVLHRAGIRGVILTRDQRTTAQFIGRELNLNNGGRIEVLDINRVDQAEGETLAQGYTLH
ncbi:MAG: hypothetical protein ACREX4_05945 [Gammaproteobacteria bacterium]